MTGSAAQIRIRGLNSATRRNAPIFIIDGVRMDAGTGLQHRRHELEPLERRDARRDREYRDRQRAVRRDAVRHRRRERRHRDHDQEGPPGQHAVDLDRGAGLGAGPQPISVHVGGMGPPHDRQHRADRALPEHDDRRRLVQDGQRDEFSHAARQAVLADLGRQTQPVQRADLRRQRRAALLRLGKSRERVRTDQDAGPRRAFPRLDARRRARRVEESRGDPARELPRQPERLVLAQARHADRRRRSSSRTSACRRSTTTSTASITTATRTRATTTS